jgi:hypothetical protein
LQPAAFAGRSDSGFLLFCHRDAGHAYMGEYPIPSRTRAAHHSPPVRPKRNPRNQPGNTLRPSGGEIVTHYIRPVAHQTGRDGGIRVKVVAPVCKSHSGPQYPPGHDSSTRHWPFAPIPKPAGIGDARLLETSRLSNECVADRSCARSRQPRLPALPDTRQPLSARPVHKSVKRMELTTSSG